MGKIYRTFRTNFRDKKLSLKFVFFCTPTKRRYLEKLNFSGGKCDKAENDSVFSSTLEYK